MADRKTFYVILERFSLRVLRTG